MSCVMISTFCFILSFSNLPILYYCLSACVCAIIEIVNGRLAFTRNQPLGGSNMIRFCDYHSDFSSPESGVDFHYFNALYNDLHTHNYWEIFIVTEGTMIQYINDRECVLKKSDMFIVRPDDVHVFYKSDGQEAQFLNIMLTKEKMEIVTNLIGADFYCFLQNTTDNLCIHLSNYQYKSFTKLIDKLFLNGEESLKEVTIKFLTLDALKFVYFQYYLEQDHNEIASLRQQGSPEIKKLIAKLNSVENMPLSLQEICRDIPFSQVHINRLFKQELGMTLNNYFVRVKIKYAAFLLRNSNLSTLDVASKVGYSSLSYFYKAFRAHYGCAPREYSRRREPEGTTKTKKNN